MLSRSRASDILFVLLGVLALVTKRYLASLGGPIVQSYGGNVAASFAAFFVLKLPFAPNRFRAAMAAALALLAAELFEATNGFGFMSNTYDPGDYVANAIGVGLAVCAEATLILISRLRERETAHS